MYTVQKLITKAKGILAQNSYAIFIFLFYAIIAFFMNCKLSFAIGNSLVITLLLLLFSKIGKINIFFKIVVYLVIMVITLLLISDIFYFYQYKEHMNYGVFASIVGTNSTEANSTISPFILPIIVISLILFPINLLAVSKLAKSKIKILPSFIAIIVICALFIGLTLNSYLATIEQAKRIELKSISSSFKKDPVNSYYRYFGKIFPLVVDDIVMYITYEKEIRDLKKFHTNIKVLPTGIAYHTNDENKTPDKIYLVIGESSYRGHYSLYNYNFNTTPFLDSLAKVTNSPLAYYNAISPASLTQQAIKYTLTFATPNNNEAFLTNKTIVNLARDTGYEIKWITTQDTRSINDNHIKLVSNESDTLIYTLDSNDKYKKQDDFNLIEELQNIHNKNKKQFIVLHLVGSHEPYIRGYDKDDIFSPENKISLDYDRSLHHTDRFFKKLNAFINKNDTNALVYYYSDHGELINIGHGTTILGQQLYEIPLITINHNTSIPIDSIVKQYINPKTNLINSIYTINILAEVMGYQVDSLYRKEIVKENPYLLNNFSHITKFEDVKEYPGSIK